MITDRNSGDIRMQPTQMRMTGWCVLQGDAPWPFQTAKCLGNSGETLLQICNLSFNCRAVPTKPWIAPSHNGCVRQDGNISPFCSFNLLDTLELIFDSRAVTTRIWIAPSHDRSICKDRSKCTERLREPDGHP